MTSQIPWQVRIRIGKICALTMSIHIHNDHFPENYSLLIKSVFLLKSMRLNLGHEDPVVNLLPKFIAYMDSLNFVANSRNYFPDHVSSKN